MDAASGYEGLAVCRLCQVGERHCFRVGELTLPCPACGVENALSVGTRADATCRTCGGAVPFPGRLRAKKQMLVCYDCLLAGRATLPKSTEMGLVFADHAFAGLTGAVPGLTTVQFELVRLASEDAAMDEKYGISCAARVPPPHLWALLPTPDLSSWQGECWLSCCSRPMIFVEDWEDAVAAARPADRAAFFDSLFDPDGGWKPDDLGWGPGEEVAFDTFSLYAYRCPSCGRYRATKDSD